MCRNIMYVSNILIFVIVHRGRVAWTVGCGCNDSILPSCPRVWLSRLSVPPCWTERWWWSGEAGKRGSGEAGKWRSGEAAERWSGSAMVRSTWDGVVLDTRSTPIATTTTCTALLTFVESRRNFVLDVDTTLAAEPARELTPIHARVRRLFGGGLSRYLIFSSGSESGWVLLGAGGVGRIKKQTWLRLLRAYSLCSVHNIADKSTTSKVDNSFRRFVSLRGVEGCPSPWQHIETKQSRQERVRLNSTRFDGRC